MSFGIAVVSWLILSSLTLNRLMFVSTLPEALVPTLAIELAPPAVGASAYFALHGPIPDPVAYGLAGYTVLMVAVQVRLLPVYSRLSFSPAFWAFTFPGAAAAGLALRWLQIERPAGQTVYAAFLAGAASALVVGVAARSLLAIARRRHPEAAARFGQRGSLNPERPPSPDLERRRE
jgi:tellurite resistance protein